MSGPVICHPDPERVALAVDALCVGGERPVLIHTEDDPSATPAAQPFALFCTPLTELTSIAETIQILGAVSVPAGWRLAGLCAPTTIRVPSATNGGTRLLDAWIVHVVDARGATATRLCVPDALELSGPTLAVDTTHPLHRCLARLLEEPPR